MAEKYSVTTESDVRSEPTLRLEPAASRTDTKIVVLAVGAGIVLFVVGLILGFLLGHQTASNSRGSFDGSMMNDDGNFRGRAQTQSSSSSLRGTTN